MEYERKGVIITWQIKNLKSVWGERLQFYSPVLSMDFMDGTKWRLGVIDLYSFENKMVIKREEEDNGPEQFGLDYEFSVLHETSTTEKRTRSYTFTKNQSCPDVSLTYRRLYLAETITIRCKMWRQTGSISNSAFFFFQSRLTTECCTFLGEVEHFSDFHLNDKRTLKTVSSSSGEKLMTVKLYLIPNFFLPKEDFNMQLELTRINDEIRRFGNFEVFILDSSGNIGKRELELRFHHKGTERVCLRTSIKYLKENADRYLKNDTLFLHCELTFWSGIEHEKVERIYNESDCLTEVEQSDYSKTVEFQTKRKRNPCDIRLQTATETFPAHTIILSAQSPVFEAMFRTNMKEAIQKCVYIDDLEDITLKRMLVFLYSGNLEKLEWKDAVKLYVAADKYQILSLKQKCTDFLTQNIDLSNCCVLLHLSDMHQDNDLKIDVTAYIATTSKAVLHCDQWRDLEKNLPHLSIETLRYVLRRNGLI